MINVTKSIAVQEPLIKINTQNLRLTYKVIQEVPKAWYLEIQTIFQRLDGIFYRYLPYIYFVKLKYEIIQKHS